MRILHEGSLLGLEACAAFRGLWARVANVLLYCPESVLFRHTNTSACLPFH